MGKDKRKRSDEGYKNQRRRSAARYASRIAGEKAPLCPAYILHVHSRETIELRLVPPVSQQHTESAFQRFRGAVITALRPVLPDVRWIPHTVKPPSQHYHPRWWRLHRDNSKYGYVTVELTSHNGPARFRILGSANMINEIARGLFPPMDYESACRLPSRGNDDSDRRGPDADPGAGAGAGILAGV